MKLNTSLLIRGLRKINVGLSESKRAEWAISLRRQRYSHGRRKTASFYM